MRRWAAPTALALALCLAQACASNPAPVVGGAPTFVALPTLEIPATLTVSASIRERHQLGWQRLQAGDVRGASRDFSEVLKKSPQFYPAETGLGFCELAGKNYKSAASHFSATIALAATYLPAWLGQAEALLALNRDADAVLAMERILVLDPKRDTIRTRLELVRFRALQTLVESGRKAHAARKLDDAARLLNEALVISPTSTLILHELALVYTDAGRHAEAEETARKATELEPRDPEWQALLAATLEAQQKYRLASEAYSRAAVLESRPDWRAKASELRAKADLAALPADFGKIGSATGVTRADAAAYIGIELADLIEAAPRRVTDVATDAPAHWSAPWILLVTRTGVMSIYPNHTFQPANAVRRADLATIVSELLRLATAARPADLIRWQAGRPRFSDLPTTHVLYRAAALAVSSGAMGPDPDNRFDPTRAASGADLVAAVRRIKLLTSR